jgi:hypothetical protein
MFYQTLVFKGQNYLLFRELRSYLCKQNRTKTVSVSVLYSAKNTIGSYRR